MGELSYSSSSSSSRFMHDVFLSFNGKDTREKFMSHLDSSSSSSSSSRFKHDVFLSFNGKDTREKFMSHLDGALEREKVTTFIDCRLNRGCEIASSLLKAIEESKISVVIFSKNYASSMWCLNELVKIDECMEKYGQIVIPIFYEVTPSDVRSQSGAFGDAFAQLRLRFQDNTDQLQRWTASLTKIANIFGWDLSVIRMEYKLTVKIAEDICKRLNGMPSSCEYMVGAERRIEEIKSLLSFGLNTVGKVGIRGWAGIGKTTLARAVFDKISNQFDRTHFITGKSNKFSTEMLCHKEKLLLVLDDVSTHRGIDFGLFDSLTPGSRIIMTSRDKYELMKCGATDIYEVNGLFDDEALMLFSLCAFKQNRPTEDYMELSNMIVRYAKGNPLALKVLGSSLYGKCRQEWETILYQFRRGFDRSIFDVLKVHYDELGDEEKKIFLDIACFFAGKHKDYVQIFFNSKGLSTTGITVLMDKSLITISNNKIVMHDLIKELGWMNISIEFQGNPVFGGITRISILY